MKQSDSLRRQGLRVVFKPFVLKAHPAAEGTATKGGKSASIVQRGHFQFYPEPKAAAQPSRTSGQDPRVHQ
jgi:hypothetical protein